MARFLKDRSKVRGLTPGSLVLLGQQKMEKPIIRVMSYDADGLEEKEVSSFEEAFTMRSEKRVTWINIYGIHDIELMRELGEKLELPVLLLEGMLNTDQRPRFEYSDSYNAFILKMLDFEETSGQISAEQISILLFKNLVISLQEREGDVFDPLRKRIRSIKGKVRLNSCDYLAYALMDIIADNYSIQVGKLGYEIEKLEDQIFNTKDFDTAEDIYRYKIELNYIRKAVRPAADMLNKLIKTEDTLFHKKNHVYLRDLNDLLMHTTDALEMYNSMVSDQLNIYNTSLSNRMNEVMKVLTIFASIFIPLSFLAGIYGMNFEFMPELGLKWAYPVFWGVVIVVVGGLIVFFKRKGWFK